MKKILSLVLAACMCVLSLLCSAADSATAVVPVTLTVANRYRAVNVSVPSSLPVYVADGHVLTAENARICNNSEVYRVQVDSVAVTDGAMTVVDYDRFEGSNAIALQINGCPTRCSGYMELRGRPDAFPVLEPEGCLELLYRAKVSGTVPNVRNLKAASFVITVKIVD